MTTKKCQGWYCLIFAVTLLLIMSILPMSALAVEPANATVNIPVYSQVVGDTPKIDETFTFSLNAIDGAPMPDDGVNEAKTVQITGGGSAFFGQIQYTELGEYHYTISETKGSSQRYDYDTTVYFANVQVTWKDKVGGEMIAVLYLAKGDGIYKQEKALFNNRYTMPAPVLIDPPVQKTVVGEPATAGTFTFRFAANSTGAPMPADSFGGVKTFSRTGPGLVEAGTITFTEPGEYSYTVSEVNSGVPGYTYDKTVYTVKVKITEVNGQLQQVTQCQNADGASVSNMNFTNIFTSNSTLPQTGDTTNLLFWTALLIISIVAVTVVVTWKKK